MWTAAGILQIQMVQLVLGIMGGWPLWARVCCLVERFSSRGHARTPCSFMYNTFDSRTRLSYSGRITSSHCRLPQESPQQVVIQCIVHGKDTHWAGAKGCLVVRLVGYYLKLICSPIYILFYNSALELEWEKCYSKQQYEVECFKEFHLKERA